MIFKIDNSYSLPIGFGDILVFEENPIFDMEEFSSLEIINPVWLIKSKPSGFMPEDLPPFDGIETIKKVVFSLGNSREERYEFILNTEEYTRVFFGMDR